jgi:hypothetical protein
MGTSPELSASRPTAADRSPGRVLGRARHLRPALAVQGALAVLATAVAGLLGGAAPAFGAAAGVALVAASYTASTLAIAWADSVEPRLVLPVGMGMYVTKFSLFGAALIALGGSDWPGLVPMAMGICAAVAGWTGTQIWWTVHHEHPYVSTQDSGDARP